MILVRQLMGDAQYSYIANHYPGLEVEDYLIRQLRIWRKNNYDRFVVDLNSIFDLYVAIKETIPKSLKECIKIEAKANAIAKILSMPCISLQTPDYKPDQTGSAILWYDIIDLGNKRAERSLLHILDLYMKIGSNPYSVYESEYKKRADMAKLAAAKKGAMSPSKRTKPKPKPKPKTRPKTSKTNSKPSRPAKKPPSKRRPTVTKKRKKPQ